MSGAGWLFFTGVLLTIGTGLFVASEFSLVNLDRHELESRKERGERMLGIPIRALKTTSTHLSAAQLGITLTTLLAGFTLEPALSTWFKPLFISTGVDQNTSRVIATVLAVALATLLSMIVGELVPKNFALALPRQVAKIVVPFQVVFSTIFRPAVSALNGTANAILRMLGIQPQEELSSARTAEELKSLVRRSAHQGALDAGTATLLDRALSFSTHMATDVMTPRPRLAALKSGDSAQDVIDLARRTGYSRFPVVQEGLDDIVGVVHLKQVIAVPRDRRSLVPVSALTSEALRVPETMPLDALLGELRSRSYQLAVVVDEYGGTAGVATLEDLVEELVGEVADEHDRARPGVVKSRDWLSFPGSLRPDELMERAGVRVPDDGPYETVAGYLIGELGHIPLAGDTVTTTLGTFRVERMDGRRIDRVRFTPHGEKSFADKAET